MSDYVLKFMVRYTQWVLKHPPWWAFWKRATLTDVTRYNSYVVQLPNLPDSSMERAPIFNAVMRVVDGIGGEHITIEYGEQPTTYIMTTGCGR